MISEKAELLLKIIAVFDPDLIELGEVIDVLNAMFFDKANKVAKENTDA